MKTAVLFDLGNTLAAYYERQEFPAILREAILRVRDRLAGADALRVSEDVMWRRTSGENHEAPDHRVRPLEGRLGRIFGLGEGREHAGAGLDGLCRAFLEPIFARGRLYDDVLPELEELRRRGLRVGLASNTPWGSPAHLWREELRRLALTPRLDVAVFCRDVGWRKPAPQAFESALRQLRVGPQDCAFVGDDPLWDVAGPAAVGIKPILIARGEGQPRARPEAALRSLDGLRRLLEQP